MGSVTKNFSYKEFLVSDSFPDMARKMKLNDEDKKVIKLLCQSILQPLRDKFGPISIESGKRSVELNEKVGGDSKSDHLFSSGVDISTKKVTLEALFDYIKKSGFHYRQLIKYDDQSIIHISINIPGRPYKNEALSKEKGVYKIV